MNDAAAHPTQPAQATPSVAPEPTLAPTPTPIDLTTWARREHWAHYRGQAPCGWAMTVDLDVTEFVAALAASERKTYVAQVWALATVVNAHGEFRMTLGAEGAPALWEVVHPSFTVFNAETETFASVWAAYDSDFGAFHEKAAGLLREHRSATSMFPQGEPPANSFDISSVPWASFTGMSLQLGSAEDHLAPIFTLGRYTERDGRVMLPLAMQFNHAAVDGFHAGRLVGELEALLADPSWVG